MNTKQLYFFNMHSFLIFIFCLFCLFIHGSPQIAYPFRSCSNSTYSSNSPYSSNLNLLYSALSSNSSHRLYFNASFGRAPNHPVYGHFQCRGDSNSSACHNCVTTATSQQYCPLSIDAVIWFDDCLLRYSNQSFFSIVAKQPSLILISSEDIEADVDGFDKLVVSTLRGVAANASKALMFATEEAEFKKETVYTLAQCTGDLSKSDCGKCLKEAVKNFPSCCSGKKGGRVLFPSCTIRYELYAFYNSVTPTSSPESSPSPLPVPAPTPTPVRIPQLTPTSTPTSTSALAPPPSTASSLSGKSRMRSVIVIGIVAASLLG